MQFINHYFECDHVAEFYFGNISATCGEYIAKLTKEAVEEKNTLEFHTLTASSEQDYTALNVSDELNLKLEKRTID